MRVRIATLLLALAPALAGAQERTLPGLPDDVEDRVRSMQTDQTALRIDGAATIPADSTIGRDLVVEGGTLDLFGRVTGDVLVVRGDLVLQPGSSVGGDVLVVGGEIRGIESATVGGTLLAYGPAGAGGDDKRAGRDEDKDDEDWDEHDGDDDDDHRHGRHARRHEGGLDLGLSVAGNYNRVEGLPLMFGPVIRTASPNRLQISGQAIWRTEPSESLNEEIGYLIRVDQGLFGDRLRIGGDFASRVLPIETHGLNSTEAGIAAVIGHDDLHDYYEEQAWGAHIELRPNPFLAASLAYRQAEHGLLQVSDPWSLLENDDDWRLQPVVAEGDLSTIAFGLSLDTRDDEDEPIRGILASIGVEHALDQDLAMPPIDDDGTVGGGLEFADFTIARIDLRTHVPVNRSSTLNLRVFGAGAVDDAVLPPQFQRAIGGVGTLPGFGLFQGSCGSRDNAVFHVTPDTAGGPNVLSDEPMLPAYGCDRVVLGQLEYRGGFGLDPWDHDDEDDSDEEWWEDIEEVDLEADWAFFVDVARGWSNGDMTFATRADTETMADVGIGILFDQAGIYAAIPITGDDHSLRVTARLERRF